MTIEIRPIRADDLSAIVALNDAAYPAVPITAPDAMTALIELADPALVAEEDGEIRGFLLALREGLAYDSENYRFFGERARTNGTSSLYIDRIVIGDSARGAGLGRRFYDAVFARAAAEGCDEVTCEVNIEPPNPGSLAFHSRMGFARVGEQSTKGGAFVVALHAAPVAAHVGAAQ